MMIIIIKKVLRETGNEGGEGRGVLVVDGVLNVHVHSVCKRTHHSLIFDLLVIPFVQIK